MGNEFFDVELPSSPLVPSAPPRRSSILALPMILITGVMGLLAGYGALALMGQHGIGPLQQKVVTEPLSAKSITPEVPERALSTSRRSLPKPAHPLVEPRTPTNSDFTPYEPPQPVAKFPTETTPPSASSTIVPKALVQPVGARIIENVAPSADNLKPAAVVTLTLEKPVLHVIAETDKPDLVTCDIAFSLNLLDRGGDLKQYKTVAENLGVHTKRTVELGARITGAGAAVEIIIIRRDSAVVCELRPLFSLPSGDIQPFTISRGTKTFNDLSRSVANAKSAGAALPNMKSTLSRLQADLDTAKRATTAYGDNPVATAAGRNAAIASTVKLPIAIKALNKKIDAAEQLQAQQSVFENDLARLNEVSDYAKTIANISTIAVRFHVGGETIPASVK